MSIIFTLEFFQLIEAGFAKIVIPLSFSNSPESISLSSTISFSITGAEITGAYGGIAESINANVTTGYDSFSDLDFNGASIITDYENFEEIEFRDQSHHHDGEPGPMPDLSTLISVTESAEAGSAGNTVLSFAEGSGMTGSLELEGLSTGMDLMAVLCHQVFLLQD